jgi:hypothetical protein
MPRNGSVASDRKRRDINIEVCDQGVPLLTEEQDLVSNLLERMDHSIEVRNVATNARVLGEKARIR